MHRRFLSFTVSFSSVHLLLATAIFLSGAIAQPASAASLSRATLHKMDVEIEQAIDEGKLPGAVLWVEHGQSRYSKAYGDRALVPEMEEMTKDTIFDLASLTKVIAGTP